MAEIDADLVAALKLAKSKELSFAFIGSDTNGTLILAKKPGSKVPKDEIEAAKEKLKTSAMVIGTCSGPIGEMVFKMKNPRPTLAGAIKKAVMRDAKLNVVADIQPDQ